MASPTVAATTTSSQNSDNTDHTVSLPSGIVSGNLLVVVFSTDGAESVGWPGGWNEIFEVAQLARNTLAVAYRQADGTEGGSITVTTGTSERSAHTAYRITGHEDPSTQAPEVSTGSTANTSNPDPDSLTPTGGAKDYLWLAVTGADNAVTYSAIPSNYSNELFDSAPQPGGASVDTCERQLNASSEDPGTFTKSSTSGAVSATVAVHPAAAADESENAESFIVGQQQPRFDPPEVVGY